MDELNEQILVAVLALLTDAIPRPGLSAALKTWNKDRRQPLALLLKEEGVLDEKTLSALQCLASTHLKTHQNDLRRGLEAWNAYELTQEMLTQIGDETLCETLSMTLTGNTTLPVDCAPRDGPDFQIANPPPAAAPGERFQLIKEHARGGIGQVWLARDGELQRDVAVKEIQPKYAEREDQRARFLLEAEITGNLEHPGIVPVYSLGRNAAGRPYYAMRFIRGESLSVAIRRFHEKTRGGAGQGAPPVSGIEFRQLLRRFLDVCDAMDYAHSRNVIHRDIKPSNIMLGRYGETLVVDWGLAKVLGRADLIPAVADGEFEPGLAGVTATFSGETQPGSAMGTPSYMSPEQARGALDQIGRTTDVYSLGVTLYELLTGRIAFVGVNGKDVIDKVIKGEFQPPRTIHRSLPPALEAICLKAMANRPEQRYPSVRAMAQDIEHWLADEPVSAYPERRFERLGRWLRRHRTWTYAAATGLIGISVAATVAAVALDGARRRETEIRKEAEDNFIMAQSAVEDYLTKVSENTLLNQQDSVDLRTLRRQLLENALKYYQRFVRQRSKDPSLRQQLAKAYFRVAAITQVIGYPKEAIKAYESAREIWLSRSDADRTDPELEANVAACDLAIGKQQADLSDPQGAMTSFTRAQTILERITVQHPAEARYRSALAECYSEIGIIQGKLGTGDQGLKMLERAKGMQQVLIEQYPREIGYQKSLAEMINVLGWVYFKRLDYGAALRSFEDVRDTCEALVKQVAEGPIPVRFLDLLALSHYNIATIHWQEKRYDEALRSYQRALAYRIQLVDAHPSVTLYHENLGKNYRDIAGMQHLVNQDEPALASIRKSLEIFEKLVHTHSDEARYHSELAISSNMLGFILDESRENDRAIPAFEKAVSEAQIAIDKSKDVDDYKVFLCRNLENLGEQYIDLGRISEGLPYYERTIEGRRALKDTHRDSRTYAVDLVLALTKLGNIQRHAGDSTAEARSLAEARSIAEQGAADASADMTWQIQLGAALTREAVALDDLNRRDQAVKLLQRAELVLEPVLTSAEDASARATLTETLWELARILRTMNRGVEADPIDARRRALWNGGQADALVDLALEQVERAAQVGYGKIPDSGPSKTIRELDLDQAESNLSLAISRGWKDLGKLKAHPDSNLLLSRDTVKVLVKPLEVPERPAESRPK